VTRDSRFLSRILRHAPEDAGITLDSAGWADVGALLRGMKAAGRAISRSELEEIVGTNDKRRFTLSADGRRIRAAQGHSVPVDLGLEPVVPPETLFHGTATSSLDGIFARGIEPRSRRQVHLSPDSATALAVGRRHGKPVVLRIMAIDMHRAGHVFFRADNGVWLTDHVPVDFLEL